jgi:hypothetical protein
MAAIAADSASEKGWRGMVSSVSFSLPASGYVEKARKAASSTVQFSQKVLWSTTEVAWSSGKAAWSAGASLLVSVVPRRSKMDLEVDLEGGGPATPRS